MESTNQELRLLPNTSYHWEPETIFPMNGNEFSLLFNTFSAIVGNPDFNKKLQEASETIAINKSYELVEHKLAESVLRGDSIVVKPETKNTQEDKPVDANPSRAIPASDLSDQKQIEKN